MRIIRLLTGGFPPSTGIFDFFIMKPDFRTIFYSLYPEWAQRVRVSGLEPDQWADALKAAALAAWAAPSAEAARSNAAAALDARLPVHSGTQPPDPDRLIGALRKDNPDLAIPDSFSSSSLNLLVAYLWGETDEGQEAQIRHWVDAAPHHLALFDAAFDLWDRHGWSPGERIPSAHAIWAEVMPQEVLPKAHTHRRRWPWFAGSAAIALISFALYFYFRNPLSPEPGLPDRQWPAAPDLQFLTPDSGLKVWLSPGSTLSRGKGVYRVTGEALFFSEQEIQVADSLGSWHATTHKGEFLIKTRPVLRIEVKHDSLRVITRSESFLLQKNHQLVFDARARAWWRTFAQPAEGR